MKFLPTGTVHLLSTIFLLLTLCCLLTVHSAAPSSKCNDKEFEVVFSKIISFGEPDRKYPESLAEIAPFCAETSELLRRFEDHKNRCLKATMRNFVGILSYSIKVQIKRLCTTSKKNRPTRVLKLVAAAPCINRNNLKVGACMDAMSLAFAGIRRAPDEQKMPHICCQYVHLQNCFKRVMYADGCQKETPILQEQMHLVMGNYIDSSCGEYSAETDRCERLGPPPRPPKGTKSKKKFITNLVDIFDSIQ